MSFYNGNKLLSLKDLSRRDPEIFFCVGNRTAGKTFFFKRWMVRRFVKYGERFVVFVRFIDDLPSVAEGFWADIGPLAFPGKWMVQAPLMHGKAAELLIDGARCGYVMAINDPERIKRNSALFADAVRGFFDEFQSETGKYVSRETEKFNSIRLSIARGGASGKHARYFPVYMCSNAVSVFNPYFDELGVAPRLQPGTRYLRGNGWVLEQTFNVSAAEAITDNFKTLSDKELQYATQNKYLRDDKRFVEDLPGAKTCIGIISRSGRDFGLWETPSGIMWMSRKVDPGCTARLVFFEEDHAPGSVLVARGHPLSKMLREAYDKGAIRFDGGAARNCLMTCLSYV